MIQIKGLRFKICLAEKFGHASPADKDGSIMLVALSHRGSGEILGAIFTGENDEGISIELQVIQLLR